MVGVVVVVVGVVVLVVGVVGVVIGERQGTEIVIDNLKIHTYHWLRNEE